MADWIEVHDVIEAKKAHAERIKKDCVQKIDRIDEQLDSGPKRPQVERLLKDSRRDLRDRIVDMRVITSALNNIMGSFEIIEDCDVTFLDNVRIELK